MSDLFRLYRLFMKKRQNHITVSSTNILSSESNGSQGWLPLQVKIKTKARFLAKRPQGLLATTQTKKFVLLTFITFINTISKKTFITYKKQEAKNMFCSESNGSQGGFHYR